MPGSPSPARLPPPPGGWWIDVLAFGAAGGLLLVVLQLLEYRFVVLGRAQEVYVAGVALVCIAAGLWVGWRLRREPPAGDPGAEPRHLRNEPVGLAAEPSGLDFSPDDARRQELGITPREMEVLCEVARGLSNRELAAQLGVSENTVKTHLRRLFDKLGARRRTEAVRAGRAAGLLP